MSFINKRFTKDRKRLYLPAVILLVLTGAFGLAVGDMLVRFDRFFTNVEVSLKGQQARRFASMLEYMWQEPITSSRLVAQRFQPLLKEMVDNDPAVTAIGLVNLRGRYIAHSNPAFVGRSIIENIDLENVLLQGQEYTRVPDDPEHHSTLIRRFEFRDYFAAYAQIPPYEERLAVLIELSGQDISSSLMLYTTARRVLVGLFFFLGALCFFFLLMISRYYAVNKALDSLEGYLSILVDNLASAILSLDVENTIVGMNSLAEELFGVTEVQVKGKPIDELLGSDANPLLCKEIAEKVRIRHKDVMLRVGEADVPVGLRLNEILNPLGEPAGKVVIFEDEREIHELKKQVQRSDRLASLGRMASMIAHEVRNPLNTIGGHAQVLRDEMLGKLEFMQQDEASQWSKSLNLIVGEIDRLNKVVSELLHFSAPVTIDLETVDINNEVRESLFFVESDAELQQIQIETHMDETMPELEFDAGKLKQVLLNIYLNAFDAMGNGGTLTVSTSHQPSRSRWTIAVEDTGSGIRPEHLQMLFDPYFTTKKHGQGLGLSIVHNTVENLGGSINVDSTVGKGTRFLLTFPL